jgi:hypothetical protein
MQKSCFSGKALANKNKRENNDEETSLPNSEHYTIFHALFEALKDKDKKNKKR